MQVTTQVEADRYFAELISEARKENGARSVEEIISTLRSNLGYYAGYYDEDTRRRVERLFHCAHPIFGAIETTPPPIPEEAFELGKRMVDDKGITLEQIRTPAPSRYHIARQKHEKG